MQIAYTIPAKSGTGMAAPITTKPGLNLFPPLITKDDHTSGFHIFYITCIPCRYISTKYALQFSKDPVRPNTFHPGISIEDIGIWKHGIHVIQLGGIPSTNIRV